MVNSEALTITITFLRKQGLIKEEHEALVTALESLAFELDDSGSNANLWRQYLSALESLPKAQIRDGEPGTW